MLLTGAAYTALFLAGVVEGLIGSFQYSRNAPLGAIVFCIVLLATCLLGAWGMRSITGAVWPAVGWILVSFVLSMPVPSGSVIITDTTAGNDDPRCFWRADVDQAARALLDIIDEVRPQVLVTYDANGAYGHPDPIQAHRVARRAVELAGPPLPDGPRKFYATAALGSGPGQDSTEIDAGAWFGRKLAAMRAHATQITVDAPFFALSNQIRHEALGVECFTRMAPSPDGSGGRETGLFRTGK